MEGTVPLLPLGSWQQPAREHLFGVRPLLVRTAVLELCTHTLAFDLSSHCSASDSGPGFASSPGHAHIQRSHSFLNVSKNRGLCLFGVSPKSSFHLHFPRTKFSQRASARLRTACCWTYQPERTALDLDFPQSQLAAVSSPISAFSSFHSLPPKSKVQPRLRQLEPPSEGRVWV